VTLEKVVRPYVAPSVFSGTVVPPATPKQPTRALLSWTGQMPGDFQTFQPGPFYYPSTKQTQDESDKKQTKKEKVRVENPDDSSQYVVVERVKSMTMTDQTGKKLSMDFSGLWDSSSGGGTFNEGGSSAGSGAGSGPGSGKPPPPPPTIDLGPPDGAPPGWSASHPDQPWVGEDATPPPDTPGTPLPASFRVTSVTKEIVTFPFPLAADLGGGDDSIPIENQGADDGTLPKYGTDANPVKFDPFRTLRSVGWGGGVYALFNIRGYRFGKESGWEWCDGTVLKANPIALLSTSFTGAKIVFTKAPGGGTDTDPPWYQATYLLRVATFGQSAKPGKSASKVATLKLSGSTAYVKVREYIGIYGYGFSGAFFKYLPSGRTSEFMSYPGNSTDHLVVASSGDLAHPENAHLWIKSTGGPPNSSPNTPFTLTETGVFYGQPEPDYLTDLTDIYLWESFGIYVKLYPIQGHAVYPNDPTLPIRRKNKDGTIMPIEETGHPDPPGSPRELYNIDAGSMDAEIDFAIVKEPYVKNNTKDRIAKVYPIQDIMFMSYPDNGAVKFGGYDWQDFRKNAAGRLIFTSEVLDSDQYHKIHGGPPPPLDSVPPDTAPP